MQYKENLPNSYCDEKELTINVDKKKLCLRTWMLLSETISFTLKENL